MIPTDNHDKLRQNASPTPAKPNNFQFGNLSEKLIDTNPTPKKKNIFSAIILIQ